MFSFSGLEERLQSQREKKIMRKNLTLLAILGSLAVAMTVCVGSFSRAATPAPGPSGYHVIKTIPIPGEGGWDYVTVDSDARRIYVSHATQVVVLDADSYAIVGSIPDTQGVHGIAIASDLGRGFTSNGRSNDVTIFDLRTLKSIGTVKTDVNPDAILYEPVTKRVFTFNGGSRTAGGGKNATAINAADGTVLGTIDLRGKPEFAAADGRGSVYANNDVVPRSRPTADGSDGLVGVVRIVDHHGQPQRRQVRVLEGLSVVIVGVVVARAHYEVVLLTRTGRSSPLAARRRRGSSARALPCG